MTALTLAAQIARKVGMVPTWPNVQTIRLAIECEAAYSEVSAKEAAEVIARAARELSCDPNAGYVPTPTWLERELARRNRIDRFWFEDALWRRKPSYWEFSDRRRAA